MYANVLRDAALVEPSRPALVPLQAYLAEAARSWQPVGPRAGAGDAVLEAALHAVDFHTWRSLAREGGVSRERAVELTSAMVLRAAGR